MDDGNPMIGLVVLVILLIVKGIISNAKAAINNLNEMNIKKKADEGDKDSLMLMDLMDKPERYIYAIDVIITSISVLCGIIYIESLYPHINKVVKGEGFWYECLAAGMDIIAFIFIVVIIVLFGSLIPKKLARKDSERKAYNMVHIISMIVSFLKPLTSFMKTVMAGFFKVLGINPKELEDNVTEEEIISMVNEGHEQGVFEENEVKMISNIMEFDEKEVNDIMTNRKKIIAINSEMNFEEAYKMILNENYSRYPLYKDDIDNVIGIINMKDMSRIYAKGGYESISLESVARKAHFVPETQNVNVLFNDMKNNKIHMAVVVDEYGQTSGIVSFEDVLEEIVGNIMDEYDVDERYITRQANGTCLCRGMASLDEVRSFLNLEIEEDEFETLNGFLISLIDRIPEEGEKVSVTYKDYRFEILDVKNNTIRFVRIVKE